MSLSNIAPFLHFAVPSNYPDSVQVFVRSEKLPDNTLLRIVIQYHVADGSKRTIDVFRTYSKDPFGWYALYDLPIEGRVDQDTVDSIQVTELVSSHTTTIQ